RGRGRPRAGGELVHEPFDDPHDAYPRTASDAQDPAGDDDENDRAAATEALEESEGQSPDDPLGLYLRQMGSIPLLSRQQELDLAQRLETARRRYRHA